MTEQWLPVVGFEGLFEVSDMGRVRSIRRCGTAGGILKPWADRGALFVSLRNKNNRRAYRVHYLVLTAFVGPRPPGMECCHWNDDFTDNRLSNLRWDTRSANRFDAVRNGRHRNSRKTKCHKGHKFTVKNTYVYPDGRRACRECHRTRGRGWRQRQRARVQQ